MNSHLNHLIAQQRYNDLARSAEEARLTHQARAAGVTSSPRPDLGRLLAPRRRKTGRVVDGARQANPQQPRSA
jgi:hypothetical protein